MLPPRNKIPPKIIIVAKTGYIRGKTKAKAVPAKKTIIPARVQNSPNLNVFLLNLSPPFLFSILLLNLI